MRRWSRSAAGGTFKISGSETFVEKMIETLPALYPAASSHAEETRKDTKESKESDASGKSHETIDDFLARLGITNADPEVRKVSAFVFYLTEIVKHPSCTKSQIEECFDVTGLKTPENLGTVINNASKASQGGYVRSVDRGKYGITTNGKNLIKKMPKGS